MSSIKRHHLYASIGAAIALFTAAASAQGIQGARTDVSMRVRDSTDATTVGDEHGHRAYTFKDRSDSLSWIRNRALAERSTGYRIVVSLQDRHVWAIIGNDTVLSAPAAVAKGTTLEFGKREWKFETPRGMRTVLGKEADPIWQPPEWLYAETALENDLKLGHLENGEKIKIDDGRYLAMHGDEAGVIENGEWAALPTDEHIVFNNTLYVPPMGSKNRKVEGELGKYRLMLGDGYLLHGTPFKESIGMAATHGCVRLRDEDIEWLYDHVPVGTKVYIY